MSLVILIVRLLLAGVFATAGVAKLADPAGSRKSMSDFGIPKFLAGPVALFLPFVELACAIALLREIWTPWGAGGILAMLIVFSGAMVISMARGNRPACHCFGQLNSKPIGAGTLARNGVLASMAAFVLWQGQVASPAVQWNDLSSAMPTILVAFVAIVALDLWTLIHMLRQNGRLLLRMEEIEKRLPQAAAGLPVNARAPAFSVSTLEGRTVTLDGLREGGKPLILLFVEPDCGICEVLMPEIAAMQVEHGGKLVIVPLSTGGVKANRAKFAKNNLRNISLQTDRELSSLFGVAGTPSAVWIRKDGMIGAGVAEGAEKIKELITRALVPPPLEVGQALPSLSLPDLDRQYLDMATLKGKRRILIFWSPTCGFCKSMLETLKGWERNRPEDTPEILIVSGGKIEENKAQGFLSRVLLDQKFALGGRLGVEGTPGAVIVDEEGRVGSEVGTGVTAIMRLAGTAVYFPSSEPIVTAMLELADVRSTDIVYDLGCGDGRIVIEAAKRYQARGVGIDRDPERLAEAREKAAVAEVEELVTFEQTDLFEADIRPASVVTLFLLPDFNLRLHPKLLRDLKPGSRVVSNSFPMGDWKPDKTIEVEGRTVYRWTIRASTPAPLLG